MHGFINVTKAKKIGSKEPTMTPSTLSTLPISENWLKTVVYLFLVLREVYQPRHIIVAKFPLIYALKELEITIEIYSTIGENTRLCNKSCI